MPHLVPLPRWPVVALLASLAVAVLLQAGQAQAPKDKKEAEEVTKKRAAAVKDLLAIGQEFRGVAVGSKAYEKIAARFERRYREFAEIDARLNKPQQAPNAGTQLAALKQRLAQSRARQKEIRDLLRAGAPGTGAYKTMLRQLDAAETEMETLETLIRQKEKGAKKAG